MPDIAAGLIGRELLRDGGCGGRKVLRLPALVGGGTADRSVSAEYLDGVDERECRLALSR